MTVSAFQRIVRVSSGCDLIVAVLLTRPWPSFAWMRQALRGHHGARDADDGTRFAGGRR